MVLLFLACVTPPPWADTLVDWTPSDGPYSNPQLALNGAMGGGDTQGSFDVLSMNFGSRSTLKLSWSDRRIYDGDGADLVVFENPFALSPIENFMDLLIVEVSANGEDWVAFDHEYSATDPLVYSSDPADWPGFAGKTPVRLNEESNAVDPFDATLAGGDGFDLATLNPESPATQAIWDIGVGVVRLRSAASVINPNTKQPYPHDVASNGPDIDAVYARYFSSGAPQ